MDCLAVRVTGSDVKKTPYLHCFFDVTPGNSEKRKRNKRQGKSKLLIIIKFLLKLQSSQVFHLNFVFTGY